MLQEKEIQTHTLIQAIEDSGIISTWRDIEDGVIVEWYLSKNGSRRVPVITNSEYTTITTAKEYLSKLELFTLIPRLFPEQKKIQTQANTQETSGSQTS